MLNKPNLSLGSILLKIGIVSVIVASLVATTQSLMLYMGGDTFGASAPATMTAAVSSWLVTVVMLSIVQTFILSVATFIFAIGYSVVGAKVYEALTPEQRATVGKLIRWAFFADVALSLLIAIYNGSAQYAIFSAIHADPLLNLVTSILAGVITLVYCVPIFAFIGTVATIIIGTFITVFSGGLSKKNAPTEAPKDGN